MWWILVGCGQDPADTQKPDDPGPATCVPADEIAYDGVDQDCDGVDLDDVDEDGFALDSDCDDDDALANPDATEVPYDGVDQDCDGADLLDADADGFDAEVAGGEDCDDDDDEVGPAFPDTVGDGVDQSCDGVDGTDQDGDGAASFETGGRDCDDADPTQAPGQVDPWYDGVDSNCDRACDYDQDEDGRVLAGTVVADDDLCDTDPGAGVGSEEDCDDTNGEFWVISVNSSLPANGATGQSIQVEPRLVLSVQDASNVTELLDPSGALVPGISSFDDGYHVFAPDSPLQYSTTYTLRVTHGCGESSVTFTTAAAPTPIDATELAGVNWSVDLSSGTFTEPSPELGALLAVYFDEPLLVTVLAASDDALDLRLGMDDPQDECVPTTELLSVSFADNPTVSTAPTDSWLGLSQIAVPFYGMTLDAQLSTSAFAGGILDGAVDTRPVVDLLAPGGAADAVCVLFATFGLSCQACPDGSGDYCSNLRVENLTGPATGTAVVTVTEADVTANPSCP